MFTQHAATMEPTRWLEVVKQYDGNDEYVKRPKTTAWGLMTALLFLHPVQKRPLGKQESVESGNSLNNASWLTPPPTRPAAGLDHGSVLRGQEAAGDPVVPE